MLAEANYERSCDRSMQKRLCEKSWFGTIILFALLVTVSVFSLFVGATDITPAALLSGGDGMELKIFMLARIPRLFAIVCTGTGMSVAGLIMQQLCMNKFVSPSTGAFSFSKPFSFKRAFN